MSSKLRILVIVLMGSLAVVLATALTARGFGKHSSKTSTPVKVASAKTEDKNWQVLDGVSYEGLTVFPVMASLEADTAGFATLDQALASGDALVTEEGSYLRRTRDGAPAPAQYSGPQVNQLVLVNRGKRPLLLLAGEVVSGGKQDRIIGKDRIVPVGAEPLPLDVFCVEHGRWTGGSDRFAEAKMMVHPTVRDKAAFEQDQSQVWATVNGDAASGVGATNQSVLVTAPAPEIATSRAAAPTRSYQKIYNAPKVENSVETFAQEIERRFDRAVTAQKDGRPIGVVVAYGDEVVWSDTFASSELFETYWPKLLRSYAVEALTRQRSKEKASLADARDFLRPISGHIREESEPGVYLWREETRGRFAEIQIEALEPKPVTLHWVRVVHAS
jgi:hypothetical protein